MSFDLSSFDVSSFDFSKLEYRSQIVIIVIIAIFGYLIISYWSNNISSNNISSNNYYPTLQQPTGYSTSQQPLDYSTLQQSGGASNKLYLFYTTWCPHCTKIRCSHNSATDDRPNGQPHKDSEWGKVFYQCQNDKSLKTKPVEVDADKSTLSKKYNVSGFPTIILVKSDGTVMEYDGQNQSDDILNFVKENQ